MKSLALILISLFVSFSASSQDMNKKYVIVPLKFYKFDKIDIYGLSSATTKLFVNDGYTVVTDSKQSWPKELKENPCLAIYTKTNDISPLIGLTKVELVLMDCYQNVLYKAQGKDNSEDEIISLSKALKEAYELLKKEEAIELSFSNLLNDTANEQTIPLTKLENTATTNVKQTRETKNNTIRNTTRPNTPNPVAKLLEDRWKKESPIGIEGIYETTDKTYYILYDDKNELGGFWLYEMSKMAPIAKLISTSSPVIYKVFWTEDNFDIAYLNEEQVLVIEKTRNKKTTLLELLKK